MQKEKSVSAHMKNLQYLATEIFKVKNGLSLSLPLSLSLSLFFPVSVSLARSLSVSLARSLYLGKIIPDKKKHVSTLLALSHD